jgi:hypothetical protein
VHSRRLDNIPIQFDMEGLCKTLRLKEGSRQLEKLRSMVTEAQSVGKPKAFYSEAFIDSKGDDHVIINGIRFTSRVMRVNLDQVYRVFPYVATCGLELEEWSKKFEDILDKYYADVLKETVLRMGFRRLNEYLVEQTGIQHLARMNPGSLADWPLSEQKHLFAMLGEGPQSIGIQLTDSFLMLPIKSVSGMWFPSEATYENCQLCPREKCPGRRAPYDRDLYEKKYSQKNA